MRDLIYNPIPTERRELNARKHTPADMDGRICVELHHYGISILSEANLIIIHIIGFDFSRSAVPG